jgi:hypothetical protein
MILLHPTELSDDSGFLCEATIRIEFDYSRYEAPTRDCPGNPEEISVYAASVWVGDKELGHHPAAFKDWEPVCWAHVRAEQEAAAVDRAERMAEIL